MTVRVTGPERTAVSRSEAKGIPVGAAGALPVDEVLHGLDSGTGGLSGMEAAARLAVVGPNAVRSHHVRAWAVLGRQLRSALLVLLVVTATISFFLGDRTTAVIIGVILAASVGLGFVNEYRAERAAQALHSEIRHTAVMLRDGRPMQVDVVDLVPGDVVRLQLGVVVPADLRLLDTTGLECDEAVLTGESLPVGKNTAPAPAGAVLAELSSCALMGTVVHTGGGLGVVVATGGRTEFGRIALGLGQRPPETAFQSGLRRFSVLLLKVALVLTTAIFAINLLLHRPLLDAALFSLAIAVGITPQLLPAVVSTSLATGSRRLARRKVLVKRLVCIEDLGDMDVLVTDKTGTLTEGKITYTAAVDPAGHDCDRVLLFGLLSTEQALAGGAQADGAQADGAQADGAQADGAQVGGAQVGANPLDAALWQAPQASKEHLGDYRRLGLVPFDHERRMTSALIQAPDGTRVLVVKGAPESVLAHCTDVGDATQATLHALFAAGSRVVAVASRPAAEVTEPHASDEHDLRLDGFLVFVDRPKANAAASLGRLAQLGVTVKIATGDNALVAEKVCADLGLHSGGTLTGTDIDALDDERLTDAAATATIFARVSPEQKARLVRALRRHGHDIGFLGDGVNDALALHAADIGLSVDTAADVAKDAADVVLLEKDLGVLADGVAEGRRIFANTIKYVLMGTSSNFGNMFSAAAASLALKFLPMLPGQILLNNLLYDSSQLAIPTDHVDEEQLTAPAHWDIAFIRRFMLFFGPLSSLFDFLTFWVMLGVFHAGPALFRSGWFVESLATQTLVIFAIRTRRVPFLRSRPSLPLLVAALGAVAVGVVLPFSPLSHALGFQRLPIGFFAALAAMVAAYLVLIEFAKRLFFANPAGRLPSLRRRGPDHHIHRRASRFSYPGPLNLRVGQ